MKRILMLACVLGSMAGPALAGSDLPNHTECDTLEQSIAFVTTAAAAQHAKVRFLDGDAARRLLDAVRPADAADLLRADHVGVLLGPVSHTVLILVADSPCGGYQSTVALRPHEFLAALAAANL